MKQCSQNKAAHNLNIHMYSFKEVLGLFNLTYSMTEEDMKKAKMQVLRLHPDKSRLSSDYFLFYKKAYEMVYNYYLSNNKQNQKVTEDNTKYTSLDVNTQNKATTQKITSVINEMSPTDFQNKFNTMFEENMVKPVAIRNEWFSKEEPTYNVNETVTTKNMGTVFENIKQQQMGMVKYRGVQENVYTSGARLYDDISDDTTEDEYISCDLFNKLKFEDIRKVHKDQTIFAISEKDYANSPQYKSVEQYNRARGQQDLTPLEKSKVDQYFAERDKTYRERMAHLEHQSHLRSMEYAEKNKTVLSSFLHLTNS